MIKLKVSLYCLFIIFIHSVGSKESKAQSFGSTKLMEDTRTVFKKNQQNEDDYEPVLQALLLDFNINARFEDFESGNYLTPSIFGSWQEYIVKPSDESSFRSSYSIEVTLNAPNTLKERSAAENRILLSKGVGNISGSLFAGFINSKNTKGIVLGVQPTFSWQNEQQLEQGVTDESFTFWSANSYLRMWTGPILFNIGASYSFSNSQSLLAQNLDNEWTTTILGALKFARTENPDDYYYLTLKGLIGANTSRGAFEVSIARTLNFYVK